MTEPNTGPATRLMREAAAGDPRAADQLLPLVYHELRSLARAQLGRAHGGTLQATALVHEVYLKLVGREADDWNGRSHFFGAAANAMRQILVDQARRKAAIKHGGGSERREFHDDLEPEIVAPVTDVLGLDVAIRELEAADPRKGQIVMLRYFAGLTVEETALAMGVSTPTINREWRFIRSFLHTRLKNAIPDE